MDDEAQSAQNTNSGQKITPSKTAENPPAIQPATEEQLQEAEQKIEKRMSAFERSMIRLTWAAVIVSVLSALVFGGQLYEMITGGTATDKLVDYAKTQSEAANSIAGASSDFTDSAYWMEQHMDEAATSIQDSVDTSEQNTKAIIQADNKRSALEQRPYIWFLSRRPVVGPDKPMLWNVETQNYGRSTAFRLHTCIAMLIEIPGPGSTPVPLNEGFTERIPAPSFDVCIKRASNENRSLAPPGDRILLTAFAPPPPREYIDLIRTTFGSLIVEGISEYEDAVGNHYQTTFCDIYSPPENTINVQCPYYNDMK